MSNTTNTYNELAKTKKYAIVECPVPGLFRIENRKGLYADQIPHIEIPRSYAEELIDELEMYKEYPKGERKEGRLECQLCFDTLCDLDFENEHAELYPEEYI